MATVESFAAFAPEVALTLTILAVIVVDLVLTRPHGGNTGPMPGYVALAGTLVALALNAGVVGHSPPQWIFGRMLVFDNFATFFKLLLGLALAAAILMSLGSNEVRGRPNEGEYHTLLLSSGLGALLMAGAGNLLMVYLSLEFLSLTSYVLTGFLVHNRRSGEAALKYLIYGGVASGAMIYGMSWLFGLTGSLDYAVIAERVGQLGAESQGALFVALVLILAGFGYKIAAVPFHMWAPDVYTGAPIPVTAFLAVGSKAAGFAVLLRFFHFGVGSAGPSAALAQVPLVPLAVIVCALTMTLGNLAALGQTNLKRLLAYSSIAHAGYGLLGFVVFAHEGVQAVLFYLAVYYLMNLGAFWVVMMVANATGREDIEGYRGLAWRGGAWPAIALAVFLFSLAGLPPLAGFVGKFYVFAAVIQGKLYLLAVIGVLNSVVSLYYYARVVRTMFLDQPQPGDPEVAVPIGSLSAVGILSLATLYLGIRFGALLELVGIAAPTIPG